MHTVIANIELGDKTLSPLFIIALFSSSLHGGSPVIRARSDLRVKMRENELKELGTLFGHCKCSTLWLAMVNRAYYSLTDVHTVGILS